MNNLCNSSNSGNIQSFTMRELPSDQRPYEKCLSLGPEALSDAELLAVILRSGSAGESSLHLALRLIAGFGSSHTLGDIFGAGIGELTDIRGVGPVKAVTIRCVGELSARISRERALQSVRLGSADSIAAYYMERMRHLKQEELWAAFFDTRCNLIRDVLISRGTVNASLVTPREVYIKALSNKAVYIVLVHNHPSGNPSPSGEDISLSTRLKDLGQQLSLPLMDHIIIGDNTYVSMKEKGII